MAVQIPVVRRQVARTGSAPAARAQAPSAGGIIDAGRSLQAAADQRERQAAIEADRFEQIEHEQRKARNLDRVSQARMAWTETFVQRQSEAPEGAPGFTPSLLKDFDGYRAKTLEGIVNDDEKRMLDGMLASVREHLQGQALQFEVGARSKYRRRVLGEGVEQDAKTAALDPAQFRDILAQRQAAIASSLDLTAEERATLSEQARERIALQAGLTLIDRDPADFLNRAGISGRSSTKDGKAVPAAKGAPGMADPIIGALSDVGLRQLVDRATSLKVQREAMAAAETERRQRQAEMLAERRDRKASQAWQVLDGFIRDGLVPDMNDPQNKALVSALDGTPMAEAFRARIQAVPQRTAAATQPLDVQRAQLAALRTRAQTEGASKALAEEIDWRQQVLTGAETAFAKDPLAAFGERFPQMRPQPLDTTSVDSLAAGLVARAPAAEYAARFSGGPATPLYVSEVAAVKKALDALPQQERGASIGRLAQQLPPSIAAGLARQLDKDDRALAIALAPTKGPDADRVRNLVLLGAQAQKDGTSTKGEKVADLPANRWKPYAADMLTGTYPTQAQADFVRDKALLLMHGIAAEKGGRLTDDDMDEAVRLAAGTLIPRGWRVRRGGRTQPALVPLPTGMTESQFNERLRSVNPSGIAKEYGPDLVAGDVVVPVDEWVKSLKDARLQAVGDGVYEVIVGGRQVFSPADGRRVRIRVTP